MQRAFAGSAERFEKWLEATTRTHRRRVLIDILTLEGKPISSLSQPMTDGNITTDVRRDPMEILELTLLDPGNELGDNGLSGALRRNRMLRVTIETYVTSLSEWLGPIRFTGPIEDAARNGPLVQITAHSKDSLAMGNLGQSRSWGRKTRTTTVLRSLMRMAGEADLAGVPEFPNKVPGSLTHGGTKVVKKKLKSGKTSTRKVKIPETLTVDRMAQAWPKCRGPLAGALNRVLMYDGPGRLKLKLRPTHAFAIPKEWLATDVSVDPDSEASKINRWVVIGGKPRGAKRRVSADVRLSKTSRNSGETLMRHGRARWHIAETVNEKLMHKNAAYNVAIGQRDRAVSEEHSYSFDMLNLPNIEGHDLLAVESPTIGSIRVRASEMTLPLSGAAMSVGYIRKSTYPSAKRRRVPPPKKKSSKRKGGRR